MFVMQVGNHRHLQLQQNLCKHRFRVRGSGRMRQQRLFEIMN